MQLYIAIAKQLDRCIIGYLIPGAGRKFDKNGDRTHWWSDDSIAQFNQRAQCFVDQYNNYSLQGYQVYKRMIMFHENSYSYVCKLVQVDGKLTLSENIADNGGVHTAFQAYKNVMNEVAAGQSSLIGGHTVDQLFFVAFAQVANHNYYYICINTVFTWLNTAATIR